MNKIRTSFKKYHKIILFLSIIFVIGLISGFLYFNFVKDNIVIDLENELFNLSYKSNNLVFHSIVLSLIIIFSFLFIGTIIGLFTYFYEAMSIGFILGAFFSYYSFSGFLYGLFYNFIFKGVYVILLTIILIKIFNFSRNLIGYFVLKKEGSLKDTAIDNFIAVVKYLIIILLNEVALIIIGNKLLKIFDFLIMK